jgi:hypothetical protein
VCACVCARVCACAHAHVCVYVCVCVKYANLCLPSVHARGGQKLTAKNAYKYNENIFSCQIVWDFI